MALMAKMRSLAPVFIIGVGVLFVAFMVLTDSNVLEAIGGTSNEVGSINGEDITYQQFQQFMDQARQQQEQQSGQPIDDENLEQFRDQVWNSLVQQILIEQQLEKYGVFVTDDEIREVILGENPPDFLKQNFIDSLGNFNRQAYEAAIFDPRNEQALVQAEDVIRQQLLSQKLQSILFASVTVSEGEIKRRFIDNNIFMSAEYVLADLATIPDSVIKYSDEQINAYYEEHKDNYKHPEQRRIKYVLFPVDPSAEDSAAILKNMLNVREYALTDTADFKTVIDIYSDAPYSRDTIAANKVPESIKDSIAEGKIGDIIGPVINQGAWELYKVVEVINAGDEYVKASHILISSAEGEAEALEEANRIYNELKQGADFAALAEEYSEDPGSAANGGDLGWFGKGRMVPEFEQAAFSGRVGDIQAPVKTSYGYHIIKVTAKSNKNYVVEKVVNAIEPSGITYDDIVTLAGDFAYLADKNGFDEEVEQYGYTAYESNPFTKEVYAVPGIGYNKAVVNFAFDNSVGDISPVFKIPAGYVVFQITDVIESGYKPLEQVKPQLILEVREEEKYEQLLTILNNAKGQFGNDLNKAPQVDNHLKYNVAPNFSTAGNIPTIGVDYKFSAAAHDLQINQISEPVKGQRGYYLIKLTNKTSFDTTAYSMQWNTIRDNILKEKKNYLYNQWLTNLKENSEIEDKRYIFYSR